LRPRQKQSLHKAYPTTQTSAPFAPDIKKSPRLQALDTGLLNFVCGLQGGLIGAEDLNAQYGGKIAEHIVGQEILASGFEAAASLRFWARDKAQSNAEVDFLFPYKNMMIPVEVKSGKNGRLRSIHQFIDHSDCGFAVRLYAGPAALENQETIAGKPFKLLSLPYFLAGFLRRQLEATSENLGIKACDRNKSGVYKKVYSRTETFSVHARGFLP